jgi:DNA-directed RNA polymerase specialized sigma24 family protein
MTTNVTSMEEWKRARGLDRASARSKVQPVNAGARLRAQNWAKIQAGVAAFAYRRTGKRSWAHAEDLAQAAITQLWTRPEAWDPDKEPLLKHLCKRVIGIASNEWSRQRSSFEVLMDKTRLSDLQVADDAEPVEDVLDRRRVAAKFRASLEQRLAGDETALVVIEAMAGGFDSPAAVARSTGLKLEAIVEARRRIFYHADAVSKELGLEIDEADDGDGEEGEEEEESAQ